MMNSIKRQLSKILPPPMRSFLREMRSIKKMLAELRDEVNELRQEVRELKKVNRSLKTDINRRGNALEKTMREMASPELYEHLLKQWFLNVTGVPLHLDPPVTYNEKIQWLKLHDHDPRKTLLADKYLVRDFVRETIGEEYLIPLIACYDRAEQIDFDALPDRFVMKANHGSGWYKIVKDKNAENLKQLRSTAGAWLKTNFAFQNGYELHYSDIPRKIIFEEYLENGDGDLPDYKFWCFHGEVKFIEIIVGRQQGARVAFLDTDWNLQPFTTGIFPPITEEVLRPDNLQEMLELARTLSEGFVHARVDLYALDDGSIKFGEMTFTSGSGTSKWNPPEMNAKVGQYLDLSSFD